MININTSKGIYHKKTIFFGFHGKNTSFIHETLPSGERYASKTNERSNKTIQKFLFFQNGIQTSSAEKKPKLLYAAYLPECVSLRNVNKTVIKRIVSFFDGSLVYPSLIAGKRSIFGTIALMMRLI